MPSVEQLLEIWERAATLPPLQRSLDLARLAGASDNVADQPLAARDRWLREMRTQWFGRSVDLVATCPTCAETFEFGYDLEATDMSTMPNDTTFTVVHGLQATVVRWPTSDDLLGLKMDGAPEAVAVLLFERCVVGGALPGLRDLRSIRQAASQFFLRLAEKAEQAIDLVCGKCGRHWTEYLDVSFILWRDIELSAHRLLGDVHRLATAYHWAERDILALSRSRRQFYLDAVG